MEDLKIKRIAADLEARGRDGETYRAFREAARKNESGDGPKLTFLDVLTAMLPA